MRPLRILVLNERDLRNPLAGGAEVHIFEIFKRLVARGHQVTLLCASFPGSGATDEIDGIQIRRLANRYLYYLLAPWTARKTAVHGRYDLVVDVLNKLPFLSPWFVRSPCFAVVHHLFGTTAFRQVAFPVAVVTWAAEKLIPFAYRETEMLAISPSTKTDLKERGIDPAHVYVVPPGIDHRAYHGGIDADRRDPIILWVGRLEPYKRADVLLAAMPAILDFVPNAQAVFVGEGSARATLEEECRRLGIAAAVSFTGFVSEREKIEWLRRAAVVVNTSEKEGWGMTVIEGNACGAPSVASDVPGLCDSVRDGRTGLLVPYGDADSLAEAIVRILSDAQLRRSLVEEGRRWASRFSWDNVALDTERLLLRTAGRLDEPLSLVASPLDG